MKSKFFYGAACAVAVLGLSFSANAQLSGQAYLATGAAGQFANLAEFTTAAGSNLGAYTFSVGTSNVNFTNAATGTTFVNSGGGIITSSTAATGIAGPGTASTVAMSGGPGNSNGCPGGSCYSTIMDLSGAWLGGTHSFTITHDDGVNVYINGVLQGADNGAPTSATTSAYTITAAAGSKFDLIYDECCKVPGVLQVNLTGIVATPEPASIALLATTLIGAGLLYRRRRNAL
jgi:PEP-CTERM motif